VECGRRPALPGDAGDGVGLSRIRAPAFLNERASKPIFGSVLPKTSKLIVVKDARLSRRPMNSTSPAPRLTFTNEAPSIRRSMTLATSTLMKNPRALIGLSNVRWTTLESTSKPAQREPSMGNPVL
jgi:hypothetical protein